MICGSVYGWMVGWMGGREEKKDGGRKRRRDGGCLEGLLGWWGMGGEVGSSL